MFKSLSRLSASILLVTCLMGGLTNAAPTKAGNSIERRYDNQCTMSMDSVPTAGLSTLPMETPTWTDVEAGVLTTSAGAVESITGCGCDHVDGSGDITITFTTSVFYKEGDISATIPAATGGRDAGLPYKVRALGNGYYHSTKLQGLWNLLFVLALIDLWTEQN